MAAAVRVTPSLTQLSHQNSSVYDFGNIYPTLPYKLQVTTKVVIKIV